MSRVQLLDARRRVLRIGLGAAVGSALGLHGLRARAHEGEHALHPTPSKGLKLTVVDYKVPDVMLVRDDGRRVSLRKEMDDGRPVALNFIYTTCPGICPMMSEVFRQFQDRLGAEREHVHMMSISIDPEQDTPARLREYAAKFSAGPQWRHYTGTVAASITVQQAFNTYQGDKMSHDPVTLMRPAPGKPWLRIDGFASGNDLAQEYAALDSICEGHHSAGA